MTRFDIFDVFQTHMCIQVNNSKTRKSKFKRKSKFTSRVSFFGLDPSSQPAEQSTAVATDTAGSPTAENHETFPIYWLRSRQPSLPGGDAEVHQLQTFKFCLKFGAKHKNPLKFGAFGPFLPGRK